MSVQSLGYNGALWFWRMFRLAHEDSMKADDYAFRFGGIERLYGRRALAAFRDAHITIVGLGGVGSWAAESLARSGIGTLTLIDMDDICVSNTNRQLHALDGQYGRTKTEAMAERLQAINPQLKQAASSGCLEADC